MRTTWMAAVALLGLISSSLATPVDEDPYKNLVNSPEFHQVGDEVLAHFWADTKLTSMATKDLLDQVEDVAHDAGMSRSTTDLLGLQSELAAQARATQKAYAESLSTEGQDVDTLFNDVVVTEKGVSQAAYLKAIARSSQDLYLTFGKLIDARFLAAAPSGIPRTGTPVSPTQARAIAQTVQRDHVQAYEKTLVDISAKLRTLLDLEVKK